MIFDGNLGGAIGASQASRRRRPTSGSTSVPSEKVTRERRSENTKKVSLGEEMTRKSGERYGPRLIFC